MKKNKKLIIGIITVLLVAAISVGGYFLIEKINENKSVGTDWGDIYYDFIQNNITEPGWDSKDINTLGYDLEDCDIQFVPQDDGNPVMILKSVKKSNSSDEIIQSCDIFYINEESQVEKAGSYTYNGKVELLYNIKEKKYKWYIADKLENGRQYYDIEKKVELYKLQKELGGYDKAKENDEYRKLDIATTLYFSKDYLPPKEIKEDTPISSFEENLIEIENNPEIKKNNIGTIQDLKETKKIIRKAVSEYKTMKDVVTENVKQSVTKKIEKIEKRKEAIKKKAEEDAAKKAQEDAAKKSFKVGKYTMMYGTYKGSGGFQNDNEGRIFVLKSNGTYTITKNGSSSNGTFTYNSDGYINFDGGSWSYTALGNNVFGEPAGAGYDEKFTYSGN